MRVTMKTRFGYKDFFDDEPLELKKYLEHIGKDDIFLAITFFVNAAHPASKHQNFYSLIDNWFSINNASFKKSIKDKINGQVGFINITSSLELVEFAMQNEFPDDTLISNEEFQVNLFKAYSLLNSKQDKIEEAGYQNIPTGLSDDDKLLAGKLISTFHDSDLINYDLANVLFSQFVKSIEFFKYLESASELKPHTKQFMAIYNVVNWQEWLRHLLSNLTNIVKNPDKSYYDFHVEQDNSFERNCAILGSLTLKDDDSYQDLDYITLRSNPFIKMGEGHFRVVNCLFLAEKLYKSILFQFSLTINNSLPEDQKIKNFRGDHCLKFSERTLFYQAIKGCFPKKWIHFSGDDFVRQGYNNSEPDYYLRFKNKLLLFESKDVVLKGVEKQSRDYEVLSSALEKKFYKDTSSGKLQLKAVLQLIGNVKRVLQKFYTKCDIDYDERHVKIYPIIVTHDRQFDSLGVNKLVSKWFKEELSQLSESINISNVQDVVIINIDKLLQYQSIFKVRGKVRFEELINEYQNFTKPEKKRHKNMAVARQALSDSFISFSHFLEGKLQPRQTDVQLLIDYIEFLIRDLGTEE